MDLGLNGRVAVVTGGAGRIGSSDCKVLAAEGAHVAVLDLDQGGAESVAKEVNAAGGKALAVSCDLTDRDDVARAIDHITDEAGPIDILVNNAGLVDGRGRLGTYDDDTWDRDVSVNLTTAYNITKAVFPGMCERGWGRIITMSSIAGKLGGFGQASYSATKAGLIGLGRTVALEGAKHGVTSNILAPTIVVGDLQELPMDMLEQIDKSYARIAKATPARKLGREEDVANLVAYLASEHAGYVTGQVIGVTGGVDLFCY